MPFALLMMVISRTNSFGMVQAKRTFGNFTIVAFKELWSTFKKIFLSIHFPNHQELV